MLWVSPIWRIAPNALRRDDRGWNLFQQFELGILAVKHHIIPNDGCLEQTPCICTIRVQTPVKGSSDPRVRQITGEFGLPDGVLASVHSAPFLPLQLWGHSRNMQAHHGKVTGEWWVRPRRTPMRMGAVLLSVRWPYCIAVMGALSQHAGPSWEGNGRMVGEATAHPDENGCGVAICEMAVL